MKKIFDKKFYNPDPRKKPFIRLTNGQQGKHYGKKFKVFLDWLEDCEIKIAPNKKSVTICKPTSRNLFGARVILRVKEMPYVIRHLSECAILGITADQETLDQLQKGNWTEEAGEVTKQLYVNMFTKKETDNDKRV